MYRKAWAPAGLSAAMASPIITLRHMPRTEKNCISHPNRFFMNPFSPPAIESHSKGPGHQSTAGKRLCPLRRGHHSDF